MGTHSLPLPSHMTKVSLGCRLKRSRPRLTAQQRANCVVREVRCTAEPNAVRTALVQAFAVELNRMRASNHSDEAIRTFVAASDVHVANCDADGVEGRRALKIVSGDHPRAGSGEAGSWSLIYEAAVA